MSILRIPTEVVYTLGTAFDGIVYAVYTALILTAGTILWYFLWWLIQYFFAWCFQRTTTWVLKERRNNYKDWIKRPTRTCGNVGHLVFLTLFYGGLVIIVWLASASAGFNPWTSAAASLGISIIATYAFGTPLGLLGSGYFIHLTNAIGVGDYYEFAGLGPEWEGKVVGIYSMWVELARFNDEKDKQTGELIYMPISTFLTTPRKRNWKKECAMEEQFGYMCSNGEPKLPKPAALAKPPLSSVPQGQTAPAARRIANKFAEHMV